jgi:uncharacterized protein YabN with tetrapyrrole methylase and pyrophosphatase domain
MHLPQCAGRAADARVVARGHPRCNGKIGQRIEQRLRFRAPAQHLIQQAKLQRRVASTGFDFEYVPYDAVADELEELRAAGDPEQAFHELGDVLFAAVNVARKLHVDPELALRAAADRFRGRVEAAERLASGSGTAWGDLSTDQQLGYYAQARLAENGDPTKESS